MEHFWNGCKHNYYQRWKKKDVSPLNFKLQRVLQSKAPFLLPDDLSGSPHETPSTGHCLQHFSAGNMGHTASSRDAKIVTNCKHTHLIDVLKTSALDEILLSKHAFQ